MPHKLSVAPFGVIFLILLFTGSSGSARDAMAQRRPPTKFPPAKKKAKTAKKVDAVALRNVALLKAIAEDDISRAEELLDKGASPNARDEESKTSLMLACLTSTSEESEMLTSKRGDPDLVELLLEKGADVNARSKDGATVLMAVAATGNKDILSILLEAGAKVNAATKNGLTSLMMACGVRQNAIVKLLLEKGADVNAKDKRGVSALLWSILPNKNISLEGRFSFGKENAFTLLIAHRADIQMEGSPMTPLMAAAYAGDCDKAQVLLEKGAKVNAIGVGGFTPLIGAIMTRKARLVKLLLAKGADPNGRLANGATVLMLAAENGNYAIVEQLLKAGAATETSGLDGKTALQVARSKKIRRLPIC